MTPIELRSDNAAGAAPELIAALGVANSGSALAYGGDALSARLRERVAEVFEKPDVTVFPVTTGTAANALSLSTLCPPWGAVLCHQTAHIIVHECGATSLFGGGAQLRGLPGADHRIGPEELERAFATTRWGDPHESQPAVLSLTQPTDRGTLYPVVALAGLAAQARARKLRMHVDGARFANALVALGCTPAELTWRAGVDLLSLGATKNGGLSCDAIVCFDPALSEALTYRVKRAGHVASKMRFQSAQLLAYLTDDLWLRLAGRANAAMARLAQGLTELGLPPVDRPAVNIAFVNVPDALADQLEREGLAFYRTGPGQVRFVTSFQTSDADVDAALSRVRSALASSTT